MQLLRKIFLLSLVSFYIYGGELDRAGLETISNENNGNGYEITLNSGEESEIAVFSNRELTAEDEILIARTYELFYKWDEMVVESFQLNFDSERLSIIIKPESLIYKGMELSQYLPSGIQLYYEKFYEYDFRMFKDLLFMRLKGQYFSKEEFLNELYNAAEDPILYVQVHDPSYLIRQIDDLRQVDNQHDKTLYEYKEAFLDLDSRHKKLLEEHESLLKEYQELLEMHKKLSDSVISLNNRGFFGSLQQFERSQIDAVIELKDSTPTLTVKEVIQKLKEMDIKSSTKLVESVFMIYYGEYPQNK